MLLFLFILAVQSYIIIYTTNIVITLGFNHDTLQVEKSHEDIPSATTDHSIRINDLIDNMSVLEKKIINETEIIKEYYRKASSAMKETQNYFLNGIQDGQPAKSYLLVKE